MTAVVRHQKKHQKNQKSFFHVTSLEGKLLRFNFVAITKEGELYACPGKCKEMLAIKPASIFSHSQLIRTCRQFPAGTEILSIRRVRKIAEKKGLFPSLSLCPFIEEKLRKKRRDEKK